MPSDVADLRASFADALRLGREAYERGVGGRVAAAVHSDAVDGILASLFHDSVTAAGGRTAGAALLAVGGYGRRELAPHSDVDIMLVTSGWTAEAVQELNRRVMYPLWDSGRDIGNRVRESRDVVRCLDRTDEAAAVLDARLIAGDRRLLLDLEGSVLARLRRSRAGFYRDLVALSSGRHAEHGHAGHLLEPNIRDSQGGLRDVQTLGWASKLLPGVGGLGCLVDLGYLSRPDARTLDEAVEFLLRLRFALHLRARRRQDVVYLTDQDAVASELGYTTGPDLHAGDMLMRDLYRLARQSAAIVSSVWERLAGAGSRRFRRAVARPLPDGCKLVEGRVEVVAAADPVEDPSGWLRVLHHCVRLRAPLGRASVNRLQSQLAAAGGPLPWTAEVVELFFGILRSGSPAAAVLQTMDDAGFLHALIPEWEPVRCCPQRNLYHRFTVDVHCIEAVAELARSRDDASPAVRDAWARVGDDRALLLATLLHDVGKGRGEDHSVLGARLAHDVASRMGLEQDVAHDVRMLVADHLTLAEVATRRDLGDMRTIGDVVERVGDSGRLAMLYLLTRADAIATGPEAWSGFRSALVGELYSRTLARLEGVPSDDTLAARGRQDLPPLDHGEVRLDVVHGPDSDEVHLLARDRPGMFATVCGVLALRGLNVLGARIHTHAGGVAQDVITVSSPFGRLSDERWESIREQIEEALAGRFDVDAALEGKPPPARAPDAVHRRSPEVVVDQAASASSTVVEVHAADRPGLLRALSKALADAGCDLRLARIATYGAEVVDVFYVTSTDGLKLDDDAASRVREALVKTLDR